MKKLLLLSLAFNVFTKARFSPNYMSPNAVFSVPVLSTYTATKYTMGDWDMSTIVELDSSPPG
jgi:hypothetical protein